MTTDKLSSRKQTFTRAEVERLFAHSGGQGWRPGNPNHEQIIALIEGGWLRRTDGVFTKGDCVTWTAGARAVFSVPVTYADMEREADGFDPGNRRRQYTIPPALPDAFEFEARTPDPDREDR